MPRRSHTPLSSSLELREGTILFTDRMQLDISYQITLKSGKISLSFFSDIKETKHFKTFPSKKKSLLNSVDIVNDMLLVYKKNTTSI